MASLPFDKKTITPAGSEPVELPAAAIIIDPLIAQKPQDVEAFNKRPRWDYETRWADGKTWRAGERPNGVRLPFQLLSPDKPDKYAIRAWQGARQDYTLEATRERIVQSRALEQFEKEIENPAPGAPRPDIDKIKKDIEEKQSKEIDRAAQADYEKNLPEMKQLDAFFAQREKRLEDRQKALDDYAERYRNTAGVADDAHGGPDYRGLDLDSMEMRGDYGWASFAPRKDVKGGNIKVLLSATTFDGVNLHKAKFTDVIIDSARFKGVHGNGMVFEDTEIETEKKEGEPARKKEMVINNIDFSPNGDTASDLRNACFNNVYIQWGNFTSADLTKSKWRGTFNDINFTRADLTDADMRNAQFIHTAKIDGAKGLLTIQVNENTSLGGFSGITPGEIEQIAKRNKDNFTAGTMDKWISEQQKSVSNNINNMLGDQVYPHDVPGTESEYPWQTYADEKEEGKIRQQLTAAVDTATPETRAAAFADLQAYFKFISEYQVHLEAKQDLVDRLVKGDNKHFNGFLSFMDFSRTHLGDKTLECADFGDMAFSAHINFSGQKLTKATFTGEHGPSIEHANFSNADLTSATLRSGEIHGDKTTFENANLKDADFSGTIITNAAFRPKLLITNADKGKPLISMKGTNLDGANFRGASLAGIDFTGAKNVEKMTVDEKTTFDHVRMTPETLEALAKANHDNFSGKDDKEKAQAMKNWLNTQKKNLGAAVPSGAKADLANAAPAPMPEKEAKNPPYAGFEQALAQFAAMSEIRNPIGSSATLPFLPADRSSARGAAA